MPYVTGKMVATLHTNGRREVTTSDLRVMPGDKPRRIEDSGSDETVWKQLRANVPGTYETLAHFGGATALLVPRRAIALPDQDFLGQMEANFGKLGDDVLLGAVRTGASAATQFCVDTMGGMFTSLNWDLEALTSMLKILVFRSDGWVRMMLPNHLTEHQAAFDEAQRQRCAAVWPSQFGPGKEAPLAFLPIGHDLFNGEPTLVVFGPLGDCQFIRVARLKLEGEGYRICDGEWKWVDGAFGSDLSGRYVPLHRQIVATTTAANHPGVPLILQLHADGHLHPGGLPLFVEGLNQRLLSHIPARVLGPHGLGWLA